MFNVYVGTFNGTKYYVPSLTQVSTEINVSDNDIRILAQKIKQGDSYALSSIYEGYEIAPRFQYFFDTVIIENRLSIGRMNMPALQESILQRLIKDHEEGTTHALVDAIKMGIWFENLCDKVTYNNWAEINTSVKIMVDDLLEGIVVFTIEQIRDKITKIAEGVKNKSNVPEYDVNAAAAFDAMLVKLVQLAQTPDEDRIISTNFAARLSSEYEHDAFKALIKAIPQEGNITIGKLVRETGISRPVFNTVLLKAQEFKGAAIKNCGSKGYHVKWLFEDFNGGYLL